MKRHLVLILIALTALAADVLLFAGSFISPPLYSAVTFAVLSAVSVQYAIVFALVGGLLTDAVSNPYAGVTAAALLAAVCILYLLIRKNKPKPFVLFLYFCVAAVGKEAVVLGYSLFLGAELSHLSQSLWGLLLSVLLCGAAAIGCSRWLVQTAKDRRERI